MAVYNNILLMNHCITARHYLPDSLAVLFNTTIVVATWADKNIFIITEMLCVKLYSKDRQAKVIPRPRSASVIQYIIQHFSLDFVRA